VPHDPGPITFGEWVETPEGWRLCVSTRDAFNSSRYRWRSGERCTIPKLVDFCAERRVRDAPLPPPPRDPADDFTSVQVTTVARRRSPHLGIPAALSPASATPPRGAPGSSPRARIRENALAPR
jgi:hypothetical protein